MVIEGSEKDTSSVETEVSQGLKKNALTRNKVSSKPRYMGNWFKQETARFPRQLETHGKHK